MIKDKINRGDDVREERRESRKARKRRNGVFLGKTTSGMFGTGIKISRVQYSRVGNRVFNRSPLMRVGFGLGVCEARERLAPIFTVVKRKRRPEGMSERRKIWRTVNRAIWLVRYCNSESAQKLDEITYCDKNEKEKNRT